MILPAIGFCVIAFSVYRGFISADAVIWVKEFNRIVLGLLVAGFGLFKEWGMMAVAIDAALIMAGFFVLRMAIQAQGEERE